MQLLRFVAEFGPCTIMPLPAAESEGQLGKKWCINFRFRGARRDGKHRLPQDIARKLARRWGLPLQWHELPA